MSNDYAKKVMWSTVYNAGKIGSLEPDETINVAVGKKHVMIITRYVVGEIEHFSFSVLLGGLTIEHVDYAPFEWMMHRYSDLAMLAFED